MLSSTTNDIQTTEQRWYRKIYAGWLGKSIGGTLGMPYERDMRLLNVSGYDHAISLPAANDDLDLQLVNLHALEQYGPRLQALQLGREWLEHVFFPFDEYGYALANLRRGLTPPLAGWFNNPFIDCMGASIRSELWAMLTPGRPDIATYYAWQDALVDHAGGEGMYGEMFFAAIESQAFVESDREQLISCGLHYIPEHCRVAQAVRHVIACHARGMSWQEARTSILKHFGHKNFTDAPQNIAFTILGWLYGTNFEHAILTAINCGYDTDCTGATLGAILGIMMGDSAIPEHLSHPIGNQVVLSEPIRFLHAPRTLEELTERTLNVAHEVQAFWQNHTCADTLQALLPTTSTDFQPFVTRPQQSENSLTEDSIAVSVVFQDQQPAIGRSQTKILITTLTNRRDHVWRGTLQLDVPEGWSSEEKIEVALPALSTQTYSLPVTSNNVIKPAYAVMLRLQPEYTGVLWNTLTFPLALVPAKNWVFTTQDPNMRVPSLVAGDNLVVPSQLQAYEGVIQASTILDNPYDRMVRFIVVAPMPIEVQIDGKSIFTSLASESALPTFHRPEEGSYCECFVRAGQHDLTLVFTHNQHQADAPIMILPIIGSDVEEPGPYYYLTDMLFI
ncbi:hypothetical protein KDA_48400 [Dictyobacter alpinus]|uniref:ADP-ribosylglycohydrolase n=1 Tax=Dictyobacter alpinus TaxID=2014873 RepID=A0A402BDG5_9CHLR|nr:ADP-ribosylglycohydrolase family protein [Dictyobacter alpinus]GCE29356.1 hypothetical protein KDA_48400 [Dictyobacter alpinus]